EKRGVEPRVRHQLVGRQNVDEAATVAVGADEVLQRQRRLAEKVVSALVLQDQQLTLYGPDGRLRHVAVLDGELGGMVRDVGEHGAQIFEVEDRKPLLIGHAEANIEHAFLNVVEIHEPGQQWPPHLENGGGEGLSLFPKKIPEYDGELVGFIVEPGAFGRGDKCLLSSARLGNAREIALDVGGEDRDAGTG